ncbi:ABC transporter substrate-binding protein [Streptomyces sp. NPDC048248]|uniref:ABC transporter substrate-binding protein n=1 Tax=Streptomyces sp. NPDC048248 TaxID=3365523 RepID=UPI003710D662
MRSGSTPPRKLVILTTVAALGAALLAGCADDSAGGDDGGETTVTVGTFGVFGYQQAGLYKEYEKLHPGVKIKENVIERNDAYYPQLLTHLAAGSGLSDVQAIEVGNINEVVTTQADKFEDLSHAKGVDKSRWLDWKWAQATTEDGRTVGLGTDIGPTAMCYRKDLFRGAGLPTEREQVGKLWAGDWQKYVDTGAAYMKKAPEGTVFMDSAAGLFSAVYNGYAERFYDSGGKLIHRNSPAVKTAWSLAVRAAEDKMTARLKQFEKPWDQAFANGRFATVACAPWMLGYIKEKAGAAAEDKWDVAPAPRPGNWGGSFIGVPKAAKHKAEAVKLAVWLSAPEQQAKVFAAQASIPSTPAAYDLPEVKNARNPYFGDAPTGMIFSAAARDIPTLVLGPKDQQIGNAFTDVGILQVEQQGKSPAAGWRAALKEVESAVDG